MFVCKLFVYIIKCILCLHIRLHTHRLILILKFFWRINIVSYKISTVFTFKRSIYNKISNLLLCQVSFLGRISYLLIIFCVYTHSIISRHRMSHWVHFRCFTLIKLSQYSGTRVSQIPQPILVYFIIQVLSTYLPFLNKVILRVLN